jgi:hypothetical protein
MTDVSLATIDDIAQELERRGLCFVLYVDKMGQFHAGGDVPARTQLYSSESNPARVAAVLCDGIQAALLKVDVVEQTAALSKAAAYLKQGLYPLVQAIDRTSGNPAISTP